MNKRYSWLAVLMLAAFLGGCGSKGSNSAGASSNPPPAAIEERKVEVIEVVPRSISYTVSAVGSLKTLEDVTISPKRQGSLRRFLSKKGTGSKRDKFWFNWMMWMPGSSWKCRRQGSRRQRPPSKRIEPPWLDIKSSSRRKSFLNRPMMISILKVKLDEARLTSGQGRTESGQTEPFGPSNRFPHRGSHQSQDCRSGRACECGPER